LRQCPSRYAIRAGRNLPDKEFRWVCYLKTFRSGATAKAGRSFLPTSLRRRRDRTISSSRIHLDGWRMVSEDPACRGFLLIFRRGPLSWPPTDRIVTAITQYRSDTPGFPANSQLHSPASPLGGAAPLACREAFCNLRTVIVLHRLPHVAMGHGPYLHPSCFKEGALRMASEDSRYSKER
jgi:hypothetical protein